MAEVKLFVFNKATIGMRDAAERSFSLFDWVLIIAGLVVVADLLPVIDVSPVLQYPAYGALFGGVLSREVIVRRERRLGELSPKQVKHLERVWIWGGIAVMTLALVVQIALNALRTL